MKRIAKMYWLDVVLFGVVFYLGAFDTSVVGLSVVALVLGVVLRRSIVRQRVQAKRARSLREQLGAYQRVHQRLG